jgi:hypothetical protein
MQKAPEPVRTGKLFSKTLLFNAYTMTHYKMCLLLLVDQSRCASCLCPFSLVHASGEGRDKVGPTDYNPNKLAPALKAVAWGRDKRLGQKYTTDAPGPGTYNPALVRKSVGPGCEEYWNVTRTLHTILASAKGCVSA